MDHEEGIRLRKRALKPIETKREKIHKLGAEEEEEICWCEKEINNEEEPLSPSARLFHEPNFNVHIIAIMGCVTRINPDVIKPRLFHTLLNHPRFSSLLVVDEKNGGKMKWVRTEVDLDKHVIVPDVNHADMESPDHFVEDYIFELSKTSMDKSRPPWDLHLLNVKTSQSEAVGIFRVHHSLGDGTSLISLLLACTHQVSDPEALPTIPMKKEKQDSRKGEFGGFWGWLFRFWLVLQFVWNTIVDVFMFMATAVFLKDSNSPLKGPPGIEHNPRRFVFRTVSLDDMKFIKNAMNMTVNDVALGMTQAGLSRYLNRRYGENKKDEEGSTQKKNNIPNKIRLRSTLLVNIRPSAGIQVASALSHRIISHTTMCFSNLVGPLEEIGFYGHQIAYLAPSSYGQPHALMINFQSYVNKMTIVLSVDEDTIPDPHQLCDDIVESLRLIKDALLHN
ncbi:wax ester synthase/diacylglycerol acyltransferase 5 isoform X2 [Ziziphus jujuba]|uniref:Wax ester synthase/diacylglycerol acyltransferase 5 isoform X2 n=1 Tax=Ziziphus jujuba TaxID=326968 RepID=A0ABM3IUJ7_ZIZJJ|nr:wax ester synthase/diacylglycerol acyltransferase 5 isoform X2 [Ziziphus jujuba]